MTHLKDEFINTIHKGYKFNGEKIQLGAAMLDNQVDGAGAVFVPLKTLNRHGLIAGATGTGKTKTLQVLAENLSLKGVPILLMDIKGDLSGLAKESPGHKKINERHKQINLPFTPQSFPVEFLSISDQKGVKMRSTVIEFGPILFSKILHLNDTQSGIMSVLFKYCDDEGLPLLDLKDLKKVLAYITKEAKTEIEERYGRISTNSANTILRKIIALEHQGADLFFGEKSFDVDDLTRTDASGKGIISILRLTDIQDRPELFSTFMLSLLAEVYATFPEQGDVEKPELVIFIDEAHLLFKEASKTLLSQIETIVKLIRSKGVGLFFVTQNPNDIPNNVLGQLGMKIQHALRAFTAKDRKMIKLTAQNYPISKYYDTEQLLTSLGIGEALVSVLNEKGIPSPLVATMLRAPMSRMDILTPIEINQIIESSNLVAKYNEIIDRQSAYEILNERIDLAEQQTTQTTTTTRKRKIIQEKSTFEKIIGHSLTKTIAREITRSLLGTLGISSRRRRRSRKSLF